MQEAGFPLRFAASKLVEGDEPMRKALRMSAGDEQILAHIVREMEEELGTDREAALADMRYGFIEEICRESVFRHRETREQVRSERIDRLLTHKFFGIPIFLGMMLVIFWLTFSVIGAPLQDLLEKGISAGTDALADWLAGSGVNPLLQSLLDRKTHV